MAVGDLVTDFYQYEYNDFVFGAGTDYHVTEISGLVGYPALRRVTTPRFGQHGAVPGRHYVGEREFIIKLDFAPATDIEYGEWRKAVMRAFRPRSLPTDEIPFVFWHPGGVKSQLNARPVDMNWIVDRRFALKYPEIAVRFESTDPFHQSTAEHNATVLLTADTDALTFPLSFPLNFGPSVTNTVTLINNGSAPAQWTALLTGAVVGPRLERVDTGEELHLPTLDVGLGDILVFDSQKKTILLNGVSNRRSMLTASSKWFTIDAESSITVRYTSSGANSGSSATFTWRDYYWGES